MPSYCYDCRIVMGYQPIALTGSLLKSETQHDKHVKHTVVNATERLQSVFQDASTAAIRVQVEDALWNGPMTVDTSGRVNFLAPSGSGIGTRYELGHPIEVQDVTVVVNSSSSTAMHQFTEFTDRIDTTCTRCGREIFG